ncbi:MAG: hypothetical protein KDH15_12755 [Rhodocyclaceae bacterium]|nr:hypothetical protein [Rhodocyclaceae bacterium]
MMNVKTCMLAVALVPLLGACASSTGRLDSRFGESVATLQAQQTADPAAPLRNRDRMVTGFEAKTASAAVDRYYKSFEKPQKPVNILNIGFGQRSSP